MNTGVGALYVRRRPRVRIEALQSGGGQERGLRSGTVPTPLTVGIGAACDIAQREMKVYVDLRTLLNCASIPFLFSTIMIESANCQIV